MSELKSKAQFGLMRGFIDLGRTAKLKAVVEQCRLLFQLDERNDAFADIVSTLAKMEKFENDYGVGSCINIENPLVQ